MAAGDDIQPQALEDAERVPVKPTPKKSRKRQIFGIAIVVVVVGLTFAFVLPKIADYRDVWGVVKTLSWWKLLLLGGSVLLNLATFAPPWMVALPGLRFMQAFVVTQASTASTYVAPGGAAPGMAVSYAMLKAWGFHSSSVALAVAVTGVWNQLAVFAFPVVALALLTLEGDKSQALQIVGLIGLTMFVLMIGLFGALLSSDKIDFEAGELAARVASWFKKRIRKQPVTWTGDSLVRFRHQTIGLLRHRWHLLTLATLAGHLTVFLVLLTTVRVLGIPSSEISGVEVFASWSFVRLLGYIPLTPGGLGVIELGLTGLLVGFGGSQDEVVAAVLVYRFLTVVPTLILGLVSAATWKRHGLHEPGEDDAAEPAPS